MLCTCNNSNTCYSVMLCTCYAHIIHNINTFLLLNDLSLISYHKFNTFLLLNDLSVIDSIVIMSSGSSMKSTAASSSSQTARDLDENIHAPLWTYVTKFERGQGGNIRWQCNICNKQYTGSYSRVKAHLMKIKGVGIASCPKLTTQLASEIQKLVHDAEERMKPLHVPLPHSSVSASSGHSSPFGMMGFDGAGKKRKTGGAIEKAFNIEARETLKSEIARMFYASGLPFHLARSPHYIQSYTYAANTNIPGFVPPGYNALRTTLLQKERANIERLLKPIKGTWPDKGVTIVSDGWTDAQRRPLINFMAVTESGPMFLKAVNCEGEYKDKFFIANLIKEVIEDIGPQNVVQVITDNAPVCKAAGMIVEAQFPHIFWTPCVVHTINLALKNICAARHSERNDEVYAECHWITEIAEDVMGVKNFICNHSMRLAIYNDFVTLKLLSVAETRFASTLVMLKRFKLIKSGLQAMVINEKWSSYREDDVVKAQSVKELILNDIWWDKIDYILAFTNPIYDMLRFADTDKPCLHLIYEMWDTMIESVKRTIYRHEEKQESEDSSFFQVVHSILVDRWNKSSTPLHCLANSLNPRYYSESWINAAPNRLAPHKDSEISDERMKCLRRYFPSNEERRKVNVEFAKFSGAADSFSSHDSLFDRGEMEPKDWWLVYGSSAPMLQSVALKLLGQPCSSSCSERNWSTYSFIHSMRRNKIQPQRAEDLVFVHTNLRLLSRKSEKYTQGESKMWDIAGDSFDPFDGAGELEIANLSIDEPDMEAVLFAENDVNDDDVVSVSLGE